MNKDIACLLCGNGDLELITNEVRFKNKADVYKCQKCGLVFIDRGSFNFLKDFYEKEYHQTYITHIEPDALEPQLYYEKMKKANKIWADKFSAMLTGNEVVLDVGCSTGHFIDMIKECSGEVYGYELNTKEVEFCRKNLRLNVSNQPLKERFKPKTFDYITLIFVLEHIAKPVEFLKSLKELLKPDGKLIIVVPDEQDALLNFFDIPEFKNFYYCIEHLFYYNPATIKALFDRAGLKGTIEVIQEYPLSNHLNWAYRHKPADTLASRKGIPDVLLRQDALGEKWDKLWSQFNDIYKDFLRENGLGDRIWCSVGKNQE